MNIHFQALGCRLNEAELETWASQFMRSGHQITTDSREADVVVFNSCAVTAEADRKSRQQIGRLQRGNPAAKLIVTGCHASLNEEAIRRTLGVDLVVVNQQKDQLVDRTLEFVNQFDDPKFAGSGTTEIGNSLLLRGRHRGFVKVQDGCRYRCTYCIVTIARGAERSRPVNDIIAEVNRLHGDGVQEIAITGVHVGGYGSDIDSSLHVLLSEILARTEVPRIRLASVEPWDLPKNFFGLFSDRRLMPHMHLPIQSGSDSVLRRMARRCKTAEFSRLVERARSAIPLFNITTDIITGFPGESEQEWRQSMAFVESIGFGHMHIFTFSPRTGTKAARLSDQVDPRTRKMRSQEMHILAEEMKMRALEKHVGHQASVLWEQQIDSANGLWSGYTPHYHKITSTDPAISASSISEVRIDGVGPDRVLRSNHPAQRQVEVNFPISHDD